MSDLRMPVAFVPHGGGPWPFVEMGLPPDEVAALKTYLQSISAGRTPVESRSSRTASADARTSSASAPALPKSKAPAARIAHPREEHLIPLMVAAGAAGDDPATLAFNGTFGGTRLSAYHLTAAS